MIINGLDKTVQIKIVYFGPALSGKTTSLKALFNHFGKKDEVFSIENTMGRTLFFDYGIISFQNSEWKLKIHTYSTTGQDFYLVTRPVTLRGIDGLIFVADSQKSVYERNIASWNELNTYYSEEFIHMPKILAFNKQDLTEKFNTLTFLNEI
ncbi:MAG: GTP-binding protein, partial [Promethearchaeota archaeon]